jgi:His-Xaa-Ser system protein HxsD
MHVSLELDGSIYHVEAVQKAAYRSMDRFASLISASENNISVELTFENKSSAEVEALIAEFKKELLDQNLRLKIKTETEAGRNLILAYAFSNSGLQE